ncbi:MAG: hypothetical protein ACO1RT_07570, partial [Planctomycetaceae bacterium]
MRTAHEHSSRCRSLFSNRESIVGNRFDYGIEKLNFASSRWLSPWSQATNTFQRHSSFASPLPAALQDPPVVHRGKGNQSTDLVTVIVKEAGVSARTASAVSEYNTAVAATAPATFAGNSQIEVSVKPNPVASTMYVQIESNATGNGLLKIFDLQGRLIQYKAFNKQSTGSMPV